MANIVRYVNTASTAGGDGTTNATTGANRAYASLNEWEAAEQTDLVTDTDTHELFCTGTAIDSATTTILGWTTSALYDITIHGETSSTSWDATKYGMSTGDTNGVIVNEDFVTFNNFQVETSIVNSSIETFTTSATGASAEIVLNSCYIRNTTSATGSQQYFRGVFCGTGTTTLNNCVVTGYRRGSNPGHAVHAYDTASILLYNSVITNSYRGLNNTSTGDVTAINCVLDANYPVDAGTVTTDYCASANVITGGGANNILITSYGDEVVSLTNNAEDIRLRADSQLIGAGVGYDSDSLVPLTDISGKTRLTSVSDIGASYYTPIKHFVNTGSTAGGTGLTNATTGTDRAYASASEWEAAEATDLTASFDIQEVYMSGVVADTALTILGRTTSAAYKLRVFGDNDTGIFSTSHHRIAGAGDSFIVTDAYADLYRMQANKTAASGYDGITINSSGIVNLYDVIAKDDTRTTGQQYLSGIAHKGTGVVNAFNTQALDFYGNSGAECIGFMVSGATTFNIYNSISAGNNFGIGGFTSGGVIAAINSAFNNNTELFGGSATETLDYCASTSGTGTNSVTITTWADEFVDSANHDYHLVASGALEGQGVGPATDANVPSPDVDGDARSGTTCDIGIDEYVAGGGGTTYNQSAAGSLTSTGSITLATAIILGSTLLLAATLNKFTSRTLTSSLTPVGSLAKQMYLAIVGSITASATLARSIVFTVLVEGTSTLVGSISRSIGKQLSSSITLVGTVLKSSTQLLTGSITSVGSIAKLAIKSFAGSITGSSVLTTGVELFHSIAGSITGSSTIAGIVVIITPIFYKTKRLYYRMLGRR